MENLSFFGRFLFLDGIVKLGIPVLPSLIPIFILIGLIGRYKPFAMASLYLLPILATIFAAANFFIPCEELGCLGKAVYVNFPLVLSISVVAAVLPIAWIRLKTEQFDSKGLFAESFRPGIVIIFSLAILYNISNLPDFKKSGGLTVIKENIESERKTSAALQQLKSNYQILEPSYFPQGVRRTSATESLNAGGIEFLYYCSGRPLTVQQIPLSIRKVIEEKGWGYRKEVVESANYRALFYERYDPSSMDKKIVERILTFNTKDLQVIIVTSPVQGQHCFFTKDELIKVAESMKPTK